MYLFKITITDKNKPEYAECADEFTYFVGAESMPEALKKAWEQDLKNCFDSDKDAVVVRQLGYLMV